MIPRQRLHKSAKFTFFVHYKNDLYMVSEASLAAIKKHGFKPGHKHGGRKPIAVELKAREFILKCIGGEEGVKKIIMSAFGKAVKGSIKHQEFLMNYILGRPVDRIKIESNYGVEATSAPVVKIIADTLRLAKLEKDLEASPEPAIDQSRIEEMEKLLNKEIKEPTPEHTLEEISAPQPTKQLKAASKRKVSKKKKK